ncbi:hypothetical protein [uncultured Endozoicomonas sp.]|uniref:hypothetical protein n=1 Tax=uncultured Endozoicomonas sp. TaxID=432652 RepID=UPI00260333F9|nr:hypothetical protein [uncultured Endozoicomonas sp.]
MLFREKCLSAVLLLSLVSSSWALESSEGDSNVRRSSSTIANVGHVIGTSAEAAVHAFLTLGSMLANNQAAKAAVETARAAENVVNDVPNPHPVIQWSGDILQDLPGMGKFFKQADNNHLLQKNVLLSQLTRLLPIANDYACGMLTVALEDGWYVDSVVVNQGSIQNDHQFEHIGDNIFVPKNRGLTNLLMIKQITGWSTAANSYILENPVDFYLTVSDGREVSTLNVQKNSCTPYSYGKAYVSVVKGSEVPVCVTNASTDGKVSTLTAITSAYGKPAQVRIPGEACESY